MLELKELAKIDSRIKELSDRFQKALSTASDPAILEILRSELRLWQDKRNELLSNNNNTQAA